MRQVRRCVFETNSSSTHSVAILKKEDWEKVKQGLLFLDVFSVEDKEKKEEKYPRLINEKKFKADKTIWADERYINPNSKVWHKHTEKDLGDGDVRIEIDHYFG